MGASSRIMPLEIPCLNIRYILNPIPAEKSEPGSVTTQLMPGSDDDVFIKSRLNAYALRNKGFPDSFETGTVKGLRQIHHALFRWLYDFAGEIRTLNIANGGFQFAMAEYLGKSLSVIERTPEENFDQIADKYIE